jgi:phosphoribosylanthranilate isomerase
MRVKICGITSLEDALIAINSGADALGFVFYEKSPRYITHQKAKEIIDKLPPFIERVGLFVNMDASSVNSISKKSGISLAQIHFEANQEFYKDLEIKSIRVIRAKSKDDILSIPKDEYVLVDAFVDSYGGEGKRVALEWFDSMDCSKMILAGGLNANNLKELKEFNFYGVDVSSGVESSKGIKSKEKIEEFLKESKKLERD